MLTRSLWRKAAQSARKLQPKVSFATAEAGKTDGIISAVAKCNVDNICQ